MMNLWDAREREMTVTTLEAVPAKRYRRATWKMYTDRRDWRIGARVARKFGDAEINLPMVQFVREPWYDREPK